MLCFAPLSGGTLRSACLLLLRWSSPGCRCSVSLLPQGSRAAPLHLAGHCSHCPLSCVEGAAAEVAMAAGLQLVILLAAQALGTQSPPAHCFWQPLAAMAEPQVLCQWRQAW